MTCKFTDFGGGVTMWQCSRGAPRVVCSCGNRASIKCDYALRGKKSGLTCSRDICTRCAVEQQPGADKHYCQPHARVAAKQETTDGNAS